MVDSISQITNLELPVVTFFFIVLFCLLGYSSLRLLKIILRKGKIYMSYDFFGLSSDCIANMNLFLYIGISFFLIYAEILSVFKAFSSFALYALTILSFMVFSLDWFYHFRTRIKSFMNRKKCICILATLILLSIISVLGSMIISGEFGSTEGDAAFHSFVILRMIKNKAVPNLTFYPEGAHSVSAFLALILNIPIYKVVILLTASFSTVVFLGFYSFGVSLLSKPMLGFLCAILGSLFWYGSYFSIHFGGLSLALAIYVVVSCMAFTKKLIVAKIENRYEYIVFSMLLLLPLFAIHPIALLLELIWLLLLIMRSFFTYRKSLLRSTVPLLILSLGLAAVFCFIFLKGPIYGVYDLLWWRGSYSELPELIRYNPVAYEWNERFSPLILFNPPYFESYLAIFGYTLTRLVPYSILISIIVVFLSSLLKHRSIAYRFNPLSQKSESILLFYVFLVIVHYIVKYDYLFYFYYIFPGERMWQLSGILVIMLKTLSVVVLWTLVSKASVTVFKKISVTVMHRKIFLNVIFSTIILMGLVLPTVNPSEPLYGALAERSYLQSHSVLTKEDIILQLWMKWNISDFRYILISWSDAGQYVPIISEKRNVVYEYGVPIPLPGYSYMKEYQELLTSIANSPDSAVTLELLRFFNITYVYVGAKHTSEFPVFSATMLLSARHYRVTRNVGNAWLFEVEYT